jgi:hypothetical protein
MRRLKNVAVLWLVLAAMTAAAQDASPPQADRHALARELVEVVGIAKIASREAPWMILFPVLAISLSVFAVNLFGDSLRLGSSSRTESSGSSGDCAWLGCRAGLIRS